jgi:hypothetical protein
MIRTVFRGVSGINDAGEHVHIEHACSIENECRHRSAPACPVRRLDAGT